MKIYTRITNGHLSDYAELEFLAELARHEGKDIEIAIQRKRKRRSLNQNSFLHGPFLEAMQAMFEDFGHDYDAEMVKAIFKRQFGVKQVIELPDGRHESVELSTRDYTTEQCEDAMEKARRYYAEFWQLPYPNENLTPPIEVYDGIHN